MRVAEQAKGSGAVRDCRRAYLDLERASGRLALIGRLAALLARTPADLLPIGLLLVPGPERAAVRRGGSRPGRDADGPRGRHRYWCRAPRADAAVTPPVGEPGGHGRGGHEHAVTTWPSAIIREARPVALPPIMPGMVRARRPALLPQPRSRISGPVLPPANVPVARMQRNEMPPRQLAYIAALSRSRIAQPVPPPQPASA